MADQKHSFVRLLKNHIYPTYQLYASMASTSTSPKKGLAIAVRTTLEWIAKRMGDDAPQELKNVLAGDTPDENLLFSKHINQGYLIDIVYLEEAGVWSMQISEPDLGSNPGEANQSRQAVPGRIFETDVEYRLTATGLDCGFRTLVSDPEGTEKADSYRLSIVKKLALNPEFGLKQIVELKGKPHIVDSKRTVDEMVALWHNPDNQLPLVVFTEPKPGEPEGNPGKEFLDINSGFLKNVPKELMSEAIKNIDEAPTPTYDTEKFAGSCIGYGITYDLKASVIDRLKTLTEIKFNQGAILILEPAQLSGSYQVYPFIKNEANREAKVGEIRKLIHSYSRDKSINYGNISFLTNAREELRRETENLKTAAAENDVEWSKRIDILKNEWTDELGKRDQLIEGRDKQIQGLKSYQTELESRNTSLMEEKDQLAADCKAEIAKKDEMIAYLNRKLDRPDKMTGVIEWAEKHFAGRLYFHSKAKSIMRGTTSQADVGLLCDALEHLALEYWETIFGDMTIDELNQKCSEKYGQPFEIGPTGDQAIETYSSDYKIKYFTGPQGKKVESPLDLHLKVGVKTPFLIRIYFLLDTERKLIVIGNMPDHLKTMTVG